LRSLRAAGPAEAANCSKWCRDAAAFTERENLAAESSPETLDRQPAREEKAAARAAPKPPTAPAALQAPAAAAGKRARVSPMPDSPLGLGEPSGVAAGAMAAGGAPAGGRRVAKKDYAALAKGR
jgi:hypothetical protein